MESVKKDNLKLFYTLCMNQCDQAQNNIENFRKKAKEIFDYVDRDINSIGNDRNKQLLKNYDEALTDLSYLEDILRKLNLNIELEFPIKLSVDKETPKEVIKEPIIVNKTNEKRKPDHKLIQSTLGKYFVSYVGVCVITHIKDVEEHLFYINDTSNNNNQDYSNCMKIMQDDYNDSPQKLHTMPSEGEIFGIHLDNYLFRAIRKQNIESQTGSYQFAYLVDVGEEIQILNGMELYDIPDICKKYPIQGILCKLKSVNSKNDIDFENFLSNNVYKSLKFIVLGKEGDSILLVDLVVDKNPFRINMDEYEIEEDEKHIRANNVFSRYSCENGVKNEVKNNTKIKNEILEQSIGTLKISDSKIDQHFDTQGNNLNMTMPKWNENGTRNQITMENITEEQRKILYDESLNTSNAMKAMMGYDPKDENRICRFYNPQTQSCYKGSNCKFEHTPLNPDGWTKDKSLKVIDIPTKIIYPSIGSIIQLRPTHISDSEYFFARQLTEFSESELKALRCKMNSPEICCTFREFTTMPVNFEMVIAKFSYDGCWYRAKVISMLDEETIKVFFVDYGNSDTLNIKDIRVWDKRFSYMPFQAMPCRLAGVSKKHVYELEAAKKLKELILDKVLVAGIISNYETLLVRLWNGKTEIAEELILSNLVDRNYNIFESLPVDSSQILPG